MFKYYNPNPDNKRAGDCTVRAISKALAQSWEETFVGLAFMGFMLCDMPSANHVWGAYLKQKGFRRHLIPEECPICYTVDSFCEEHPAGTYILALDSHVIAVVDGDYYDSWDSGNEVPVYYWKKEEI